MRQSQSNKLSPAADSSAKTEHDERGSRGMAERRLRLVAKDAVPARTVPLPVASRVEPSSPQAIWEPVQSVAPVPTTSEVLNQTQPPQNLSSALEASILATLTRPLRSDEGHQTGNANRERELCELFAKLDASEAHHLGRRLDLQRPDDALARAFHGLIVERRQRLRAFIADTRRRLAGGKAHRPFV